MFKKFIYWAAVLGWMGIIFWLSSQPHLITNNNPLISFIISSSGHFFVYAVLASLVYKASFISFKIPISQIILLSLLISLLYAFSDEYHQSFVPGRDANFIDVGWDLLGAILALYLKK